MFFLYPALTFGVLLFTPAWVPGINGLSVKAVEARWIERASYKGRPLDPANPLKQW